MEATSPLFAALGILEPEALNDLARWLDGHAGPMRTGENGGDPAMRAAGPSPRREA